MIEVDRLSKRFGPVTAVDGLSFVVRPGQVTGFLGPNGAGKSTTMRLILGLDHPNAGTATIDGKRYRDLVDPLRVVGALLEAKAVHPGRSAYNHLLVLAQTQGLPRKRVDEVIELVGLRDVAHQRVGGFSLGMGQRLGLAAALLGDPRVLVLDEPVNGLDPEGIVWVRNLMKHLAGQGRTVFVSSHLMSEMALTAEQLIVIGRGRLLADCATGEFIARSSERSVLVKSPDAARLAALLTAEGGLVTADNGQALTVAGLPAPQIGELAARDGLVLHELTPQLASLEEAFMELTRDSVEYDTRTGQPAATAIQPPAAEAGGSR
jgi:ABC-2 type transport system ATP-binding protein